MDTNPQRLDRLQANGQTSIQVGQLGSVVLLGLAIAGAILAVLILAIIP